jgi:hypothetical protein
LINWSFGFWQILMKWSGHKCKSWPFLGKKKSSKYVNIDFDNERKRYCWCQNIKQCKVSCIFVKSQRRNNEKIDSKLFILKLRDLFMSLDTIFWDVILRWKSSTVNKLLIGPKLFFFSVKNHNKFSSQNIVISSQNNVPKDMNNS